MKTHLKTGLLSVGGALLLTCAVNAQVAGNSPYTLEQSVIASGGGQNSTGGTFAVAGTIGQSVAGQRTSSSPFTLNAGFWTPINFAPTAAGVILGGRVTAANGAGIRNVRVTLTGADGTPRTIVTGTGGLYTFEEEAAGETYIISVFAKRYRFVQSSQIHSAMEDFLNINFAAETNFNIPPTPILSTVKVEKR